MVVSVVLAVVAVCAALFLAVMLRRKTNQLGQLTERFRGIVDADAERRRVLDELERERAAARGAADREKAASARELEAVRQQVQAAGNQLMELQARVGALQAQFADGRSTAARRRGENKRTNH